MTKAEVNCCDKHASPESLGAQLRPGSQTDAEPQDTPTNTGQALPPIPNSAHAREWLVAFARFHLIWAQRSSDEIANDHPHATWAWSQRRRHRKGTMPEWKRARLEHIGFPLEPHRPTNVQRARELVAFHAEHGHYSPTQTHGGAALTKWAVKFLGSSGSIGLVELPGGVDLQADLEAARRLLQEGIPEFKWAYVDKSDVNAALGLTHNGYAPAPPGRGGRPSSRTAVVIDRIRSGLRLDAPKAQWHALLPEDLLTVAGHAPTALRLQVFQAGAEVDLQHAKPAGLVWTGMVTRQDADTLHALASDPDLPRLLRTPALRREAAAVLWSEDLGHLAAVWTDTVGRRYAVDIDVPLADQMNADWARRSKDAWVKWATEVWLDSAETTANRTFCENLRDLSLWLASPDSPPWIRWSNTPSRYFRFLEHQVRKQRDRILARSHALHLRSLHFRFGTDAADSRDLFQMNRGRRNHKPPGHASFGMNHLRAFS